VGEPMRLITPRLFAASLLMLGVGWMLDGAKLFYRKSNSRVAMLRWCLDVSGPPPSGLFPHT
jgi:hypothetical protein